MCRRSSPEHCGHYLLGIAPATFQLKDVVPADLTIHARDREDEMLKAAKTAREIPAATPVAKADVQAALARAEAQAPGAYRMFREPAQYRENPDVRCKAYVALCQELLAIPAEARAGAAFRLLPDYQP